MDTPRELARSLSMLSCACKPRNWASLVTSLNNGSARNFSWSLTAQSFSSSALTLCNMYWNCALLCRPPSCRF